MLKQIEGIILKTRDYGETHKIITIFTKESGKITALSRGANKPKSKLSAISQMFIKGDFLIYMTKGLSTVQQGEIVDSYRNIREDIIKTAYASYMMELTDKIVDTKERHSWLYEQLQQTLRYIHEHDAYLIPMMMYELKLYKAGGFAPVVDYCVHCTRKEPPYTFSIQEGGFLCPHCTTIDPHTLAIPKAFNRLFPIFLHAGLERIGDISFKKENEQFLRRLLDHYYDYYGGFTLKSKRFLQQIDHFHL